MPARRTAARLFDVEPVPFVTDGRQAAQPERTPSVLFGTDPECLRVLFDLHAPDDPKVLDCTYNTGKMWRGTGLDPFRCDADPSRDVDVVCDFRAFPFPSNSFDVVVFDPPHLPTAAATGGASGIWREQYGLTSDEGMGRDGPDVSGQFAPFLAEARRVLVPRTGVVFAKIADMTHDSVYRWQHVDFVAAALAGGMDPCDLLIKRDPAGGNLKSSLWKRVLTLRKVHSYWIVVRNRPRPGRSAHGAGSSRRDAPR